MKTHLDHLLESFPAILVVPMLDIGAGRGSLMIDAALRGADIKGIEFKPENIVIAQEKAARVGVSINLMQGRGESLPFADEQFGFANLCEVIEHVESPLQVLKETHRVLRHGGEAYMSVPNRFGLKDQHFHLYFVNWMPRSWTDLFISIFGKHKGYDGSAGLQRLYEMHYFTFNKIKKLASNVGFEVIDLRLEKLRKMLPVWQYWSAWAIYMPARFFMLDSFHLKLIKK